MCTPHRFYVEDSMQKEFFLWGSIRRTILECMQWRFFIDDEGESYERV